VLELTPVWVSLNMRHCSNRVGSDWGKWWLEVAFADLQVTAVDAAFEPREAAGRSAPQDDGGTVMP
jgi:hypothetical protein